MMDAELPKMPWHDATVRLLEPVEPYASLLLILIAIGALWVAFRGDAVTKMAVLIWLVVP